MKIIKTAKLLSIIAAVIMPCSCNGSKQPAQENVNNNTEGVTVMKMGNDLTLMAINDNDGEKRMPNSLFYGEDDSAKVNNLSPEGSVPSSISCFIVETGGKKILFDTGNGTARGGKLVERMKNAGIEPGDIDVLMLTHFHMDHLGGMVQEGKKVFANADVYVPEKEYAAWMAMSGNNAKEAMNVLAAYNDRLHRFTYQDTLPLGVKALPAPGHTPGHTVYQTGRLLIVGDLMHGYDLQIQDLDICPSYDMDRKQAIESRKKYVDYARRNKLTVAGMHFPGNGVKENL